MGFNPGYKIGQIVSNAEIVDTFGCGNMGGMRRSRSTNTLVLVTDYTKGLYHDKWIGGVLHYTGMGQTGDQDINWAQNRTVAESATNGIDMHLFEVLEQGQYVYCGHVELVAPPYTDRQPDQDGKDRLVWIFPIKPVPDNDVKKMPMFVFEDMEDYKRRGASVDSEYIKLLENAPRKSKQSKGIKGKKIRHKVHGIGVVMKLQDGILHVTFEKNKKMTLNYQICLDNHLIEFIED